MKKRIVIGFVACLLLSGCKKQPELSLVAPGGASISPDAPRAVPLHMTHVRPGLGVEGEWKVVYTSSAGSTVLRLTLGPASGDGMRAGSGTMVAEKGTQGQPFLAALAKSMEAKNKAAQGKRELPLKFTYANLGDHLSPSSGGGFTENPHGDWTALKLFLGTDENEAEVFLNVNVVTGDAQFAEKDVDYGDELLKAFSSLFQ